MKNDYLVQKKPVNALIIFALPIIIGNLFQQLYTIADSAIVGRFVGEKALAAVGASYSLTNVFICVAIGGGMGSSVIASRYFGAHKYNRMKTAVSTALISFLILSVVLGGFGFLFNKNLLVYLNTPSDIIDMASRYLNIYFVGLPFMFMYNVLSAMFNAMGKSRIPLFFLIFSSILNIVLDILLVTKFNFGVDGVAYATLIAQGISVVLSFVVYLYELKRLDCGIGKKFDLKEFVSMAKIALPSIFQQSTVSIGMMLVQSVVNSFGSQALAGFSAAMRIESICIVPMAGIGNAISSYCAQNIGAHKYERVPEGYRSANLLVVFFAIIIFFVLEFANQPIINLFLGSEGTLSAVSTGVGYLRYMGFFFSLIGFKMTADGVLRGTGDMKMFTIANLVNLSIRVIFAFTLAPRYGIAMVWCVVPVGWFANFIISFFEYRTGKWRQIKI